MAVPKQKTTPEKRNKRRQHLRINVKSIRSCTNCKAFKLSHHICKSCGFYRGKNILNVSNKTEKVQNVFQQAGPQEPQAEPLVDQQT